jgi:hypothetical protein
MEERIVNARALLKAKFEEASGYDWDSPDFSHMMRNTRHWVSSDPEIAVHYPPAIQLRPARTLS